MLPPGPNKSYLQTIRWAKEPLSFLEDCEREFGDCFTVRILGRPPIVFFSDPASVREIFSADPSILAAGRAALSLRPIFGDQSLLLLDGDRHFRDRRAMHDFFHGQKLQSYGAMIDRQVKRSIDRWPADTVFSMQRELQRLTLEVILRMLFGEHEYEKLGPLESRIEQLMWSGANPIWVFLIRFFRIDVQRLRTWRQLDLGSLTPWVGLLRLHREIDELLFAEIEKRLDNQDDGIFSQLISLFAESDAALNRQHLRDELITLIITGHETSATTLAWTVHHVLEHDSVMKTIRAELSEARVSAGEGWADARLPYLDAVIKETLRLTPTLPDVQRFVLQNTIIGGREIPSGVVVAPCTYLAQRRSDRWPEPSVFKPERFLNARPSPFEFFPFGGGDRRCLGMTFALSEMRIILAQVFSRIDLRQEGPYPAAPVRQAVHLAPSGGVPVTITKRLC